MPFGIFARSSVPRAADLRLRSSAARPSLPVQLAAKKAADEITKLIEGPTGATEERRVLSLLGDARGLELDTVLWRLDLGHLLSSIYDYGNTRHRSALITLLTRDRLEDVSLSNRVRLVSLLQTGPTNERDEVGIRDIFAGTGGEMLTRLKNAIDSEAESSDIHQLLFREIDSDEVRDSILAHIKKNATPDSGELKVLSDIDDTVLAWKDRRYPKKATYPGVVEFYRQLCARPHTGSARRSDLVFLTARPVDRLGAIEGLTLRTLRRRGLRGVIVPGDVSSLRSNDHMANRKFANFERHLQLYPESRTVFIGDNGQGDMILAKKMRAEHPNAVVVALIHNVDHGVRRPSKQMRAALRSKGIVLFDTYVGAAAAAHEHGLVDDQAVLAVARAADIELDQIPFDDLPQFRSRQRELRRDLEAIEHLRP